MLLARCPCWGHQSGSPISLFFFFSPGEFRPANSSRRHRPSFGGNCPATGWSPLEMQMRGRVSARGGTKENVPECLAHARLARPLCLFQPPCLFFGQHPWGPGEARLPSLLGGSSPGSSPVGRVAFAFPSKNSTIPRFRHLEHVFRGDHISIKSPPRKKQFVEALHITRQNIFLSCDITFLTSSRIGAKISALITIGTSCWDFVFFIMEQTSTPRVNCGLLDSYVGRNVMVVGRVQQLRGDVALIDADGNVTANLNRVCD